MTATITYTLVLAILFLIKKLMLYIKTFKTYP
jgi:hypothetical protein